MANLEGGVKFPVDPLILSTLRFYGLCPNQLPPNFYWVVSCVNCLNQIYGLQLDHHDINFMYSLCGNIRMNYYLKVRDVEVRLISCLPNSDRNSAGENVRVSGDWLSDELTCPTLPRDVSRYPTHLTVFLTSLPHFFLSLFFVATSINLFKFHASIRDLREY